MSTADPAAPSDETVEMKSVSQAGEETPTEESSGATETPRESSLPWARRTVRAGEIAILSLGRNDTTYDVIEKDKGFTNRFGFFNHNDVLDVPSGSTWYNEHLAGTRGGGRNRRGKKTQSLTPMTKEEERGTKHLQILTPTPELWTKSLRHRTQIIYTVDAALVAFHLDLKPGAMVVETGTGSGSLTLSMARSVAPSGRIHTFDFNQARVEAAKLDFAALGLTESLVRVRHADAAGAEGFGADLEGKIDAVFFDLPAPWDALDNAVRVLKPHQETRMCSFSPCIEQVQRMCEAMRDKGFVNVRTFECLFRELSPYRFARREERSPPMWVEDGVTHADKRLKRTREPAGEGEAKEPAAEKAEESVGTMVEPTMATHTGFLTFASRFPGAREKKGRSKANGE